MSERLRRRASVVLVGLTAILAAGAALSAYTHAEVVDSRAFSGRVASALDDRALRIVISERVVDALSRTAVPDALVLRPLAIPAVAALVSRPRFQQGLERAIRARHEALLDGRGGFTLRLVPDDGLLADLAPVVVKRASALLGRDVSLPVVSLGPHAVELQAARGAEGLAAWRWPLLVAAILCACACALLAGSVRDAIARLGLAAAGAGLVTAAVVAGAGGFVVAHASHALDLDEESQRDAVRALWAALFGDLRDAALLTAAGGVAVATLASGGLGADSVGAAAGRARSIARAPTPSLRRVRAVLMIAIGAILLLEPLWTVRVAAVSAGVLLALAGLGALTARAPGTRTVASGAASPALLAVTVGVVALATAGAIAAVLPAPGRPAATAEAPAGACNGSVALCDRRLDQVVFPATHNSFAAALEPGWFFANQRHGIARQLRDGIRGFLVDVHLGVVDPEKGRVRTDLAAEDSSRNKVAQELSPDALRTADRLVGRVGGGRLVGPRQSFYCHTLCELGAEPQEEQLELFARFLADNPREVVVLFIEPYVGVAAVERGLRDAGLLDSVAVLDRDAPLPTLGELIASRRRLVVFTERDGGSRPWYLDGFSFVQDTPYQARRPAELSCRRGRGESDSPLLLINHWIATFPPSPRRNAEIGGAALERRLEQCERERGQVPNLVAVDFYENSDVVAIAKRLNARPP